MKALCLAVAIAATSLTSPAAIYTLAGPIVYPVNSHLYCLTSQATWTDAEAYAQTLGGHLATVNDLAEDLWILNTFAPLTGSSHPSLWIGFNDAAVEGTFVWASGEPVTFTYWYGGEPNDLGGEDYTTIRAPSEAPPVGSWNDRANTIGTASDPMFGVIEIVPEPSAIALAGLGAAALGVLRRRV